MGCDVGSNLLVEIEICNFDLCHSALINMGLYMVKKISCKITLRKGLASYCKAETTFTFHFSIINA